MNDDDDRNALCVYRVKFGVGDKTFVSFMNKLATAKCHGEVGVSVQVGHGGSDWTFCLSGVPREELETVRAIFAKMAEDFGLKIENEYDRVVKRDEERETEGQFS